MSSGQKGVMLCERPGPSQMDTGPAPKPFLPSSAPSGLEPIGLVPTQKTFPPSLAPKAPNITLKSIATVRNLEAENRIAALLEEERKMAEASKAGNISAFGAQLRAAILSGDDVSFWRAAKHAEDVQQSIGVSQARAAAATSAAKTAGSNLNTGEDGMSATSMNDFVDDILKQATRALESPGRADGTKDASTSDSGSATGGESKLAAAEAAPAAGEAAPAPRSATNGNRKGRSANKPAWALTEEEVMKLEDVEEEELLKFADELDFDAFMAALDDPELQESVKASSGEDGKGPAPGEEKAWRKNLVKAMNHVAMKRVAFAARRAEREGDDDSASVAVGTEGGATTLSRATATSNLKSEAGAAKRAALSEAKGDGGWDSSTRASDDVGRMERAKTAIHEAFDFLRENPELRAVHSPASVRAMITKTDGTVVSGKAAS